MEVVQQVNNKFDEKESVIPLVGTKSPEFTKSILRKDFPETWIWSEINEVG